MSSEKQYMAADLRGPLTVHASTATGMVPSGMPPPAKMRNVPSGYAAQIVALLVASGISQCFDLATGMGTSGGTGCGGFGWDGYTQRFVRMVPESCGDTWYAWSQGTGTIVDRTATGGGTGVCAFIPGRAYTDELPAGRFLSIQASTAGIFRIWVTNRVDP